MTLNTACSFLLVVQLSQTQQNMKIICAGISRTGTKSLAAALRILGFTVHDNLEHFHYHLDEYYGAVVGKMPNFYTMYKNVDAVIAFPVYIYWKELNEAFPNAKVILMERDDVKIWAKSFLSMKRARFLSMANVWNKLAIILTPSGRKWKKLFDYTEDFFNIARFRPQLSSDQYEHLKEDQIEMERRVSQVYIEHNSRVKAGIPRDDLLVYNVKQGWKPLCEFLGVEVPNVQFPRLNAGDQIKKNLHSLLTESLLGNRQVCYELIFVLTVLVAFTAFVIFEIRTHLM